MSDQQNNAPTNNAAQADKINLSQPAEKIAENSDRIDTFSTAAEHTHAASSIFHNVSIAFAPIACTIEAALLFFHYIPELYKHYAKDHQDFEHEKKLSFRVLYSLVINILGIGALAVGGVAAALPIGAVCAFVKAARAGNELARHKTTAAESEIKKRQLKENLFFNLLGCITLITFIASPPVGCVIGAISLGLACTAMAHKGRKAVKKSGWKSFCNNIKSGFKYIFKEHTTPTTITTPSNTQTNNHGHFDIHGVVRHRQAASDATENTQQQTTNKKQFMQPPIPHPEQGGIFDTTHHNNNDNDDEGGSGDLDSEKINSKYQAINQ